MDEKTGCPDSPRWVSINDTVKTDAEGKWQVHRMPKDLAGFELEVKLKRPDVAAIERFDMKALSIDKLRDQTAVFVLRKGICLGRDGDRSARKTRSRGHRGPVPRTFGQRLPKNQELTRTATIVSP